MWGTIGVDPVNSLLIPVKEFQKRSLGTRGALGRNPMRSERIASLSRYVMIDALNPAITSATQWFERTLDDSANKRLSIPEGFLAVDGTMPASTLATRVSTLRE